MLLQQYVNDIKLENSMIILEQNKRLFSFFKNIIKEFQDWVKILEEISPKDRLRIPKDMDKFYEALKKHYKIKERFDVPNTFFITFYIGAFNKIASQCGYISLLLQDFRLTESDEKNIEYLTEFIFAYNVLEHISICAVDAIKNSTQKTAKKIAVDYMNSISIIIFRLHEILTDIERTGTAECFSHLKQELSIIEEYLKLHYKREQIKPDIVSILV